MYHHKIAVVLSMWTLTALALTALYYGLRAPVWERRGYGGRRYHGASAAVQAVPMYVSTRGEFAHERPNDGRFPHTSVEGDEWAGSELRAMAEPIMPERPVAVCIMDRATIEEINWAQAWKDLDDRLELTARRIDERMWRSHPEAMGIYTRKARIEGFVHSKIHNDDIAGLLRADTGALEMMFAEVEAHLANAEQLQEA